MNYCTHCQWETNDDCYVINDVHETWCEPCVVKALPDELENTFSIMGDFLPDDFNQELRRAA